MIEVSEMCRAKVVGGEGEERRREERRGGKAKEGEKGKGREG